MPCISASGNCQIKTGYTPNPTDKIVMVWTPKTVSGNQCLWCARANTASRSFTSFAYGAKVGLVYNSTTYSDSSTPETFTVTRRDDLVASTRYTIIADGNAKTLAVTNAFTGAEVVNCSWDVSDDFTVGSQLCLFASHGRNIDSPGNYASHYIYSFKVYDAAGSLKLDLVPAKDSNGTIGLYDTVAASNNFKTKSNGNGSLTDELLSMTYSDDATLDDDLAFDGVVTVEVGKTLNLNGHRTYSFANTTAYSRYRITFEAAQWSNDGYLEAVQLEYFSLKATQGELHIDTTGVSGEVAYSNLSLAGNMRLVKEGAGTIRLAKKEQTHIGGVEVLGGTVFSSASSATSQEGALLGERGSDVVVRGNNAGTASAESGVVDFEVKDGYTGYRFILDGGALYNPGLANITDLRLDTNSWLKLTATTPKNGTNYIGRADSPSFVDLSGYTLSATVDTSGGGGKTLYLYNVTVDDGLVDVVSGGWFGTRGTVVATNASLHINCAMDVQEPFKLRDYVHTQTSDGYNRGAGVIDIYGTFSTVCRLFHGSRLHNGATIDLTNYAASVPLPLPTVALFAASQEGDKTMRFEPGATIGVKLGSREVEKGTRVISWDSETAPDATVKFKPADTDRNYYLKVQSDGLYYYPKPGFMLIVR